MMILILIKIKYIDKEDKIMDINQYKFIILKIKIKIISKINYKMRQLFIAKRKLDNNNSY